MRAYVGQSVMTDCSSIAKAIKAKAFMKAVEFDESQAVKHLLFNVSFNEEEILFEDDDVYGLKQSDFLIHFRDGIIRELRNFVGNCTFAEFRLIRISKNIAVYNIETLLYEE